MIDETALAFERAHDPAAAGDPLDRISVRDYVREVEIGAFTSERGVTQRVRFNVVLEVSRHAAGVSDDVDQVISYDSIVDAIEQTLAEERLNLLETCAERVAERILVDPRSVRVVVRVEKLDRIPGALGVEIVRARVPADLPKVAAPERAARAAGPAPVLLALEVQAQAQAQGDVAAWVARLRQAGRPAVLLAGAAPFLEATRAAAGGLTLSDDALRELELLALDQAAAALAGAAEGLLAAGSRTEIDHALAVYGIVVWAPGKMLRDAPAGERPGTLAPGALLAFLAARLGARDVFATTPTPGAVVVTQADDLSAP